ncbi:MAG: hypothetical protein GY707_19410 [Desulfobacteraceae bacterium]|nr:hypothetical protein [Desulfobacteraceae bacterium]
MTKKKIVVIVSVSFFIIVASGLGFAMITGACGPGSDFGHRFHKRGMPPFMHKEISSFMLWRLDNGVEKLDLSKNQQKEYDTFRSKLQGTMESGIDKKLNFKQHAMQEFKKDAPDLSIIAEQAQSDLQHMSALLSENLGLFTNFYNSLDDKQKSTITKRIKERMENHRNYNSCYKKEI